MRSARAFIVKEGSCIAGILGPGEIQVNSLHRQAIARTAPRLQVEATAEDGTIEAVSVIDAKAFAVGVQWHPEYWAETDKPSNQIFAAFGDAVREYAAGKQQATGRNQAISALTASPAPASAPHPSRTMR